MVYTNYLASKLSDGERNKASLYIEAYQEITDTTMSDDDLSFELDVIKSNTDIPLIVVNDRNKIDIGRNFGEDKDEDLQFLYAELEKIKANGPPPLKYYVAGEEFLLYYKQSYLLRLLTYFPLIQALLFLTFIGVGYLGFSSARRAEQNRVWVGMAKETAHQLGTPISAIVAWIEHLKSIRSSDSEAMDIVQELERDVVKLNRIADRFSKIGSSPKLKPADLSIEIEKCCLYMKRRASRKIIFEFPTEIKGQFMAMINPPLFDWVIENLLRNALDAMGNEGKLSITFESEQRFQNIYLKDTGKGIPTSKFKTVFKPGYTTKKRGWGTGAFPCKTNH